MSLKYIFTCALALALAGRLFAHDTWVQTNTAVVRPGDAIYIDFLLGNHGNDHRDFKIAGKPTLEASTIAVIGPDGASVDLKPTLQDRGYAPKEGYWSAVFQPVKPGIYLVAQTGDSVVSYAPERVIRSAKTFFLVSASLDKVAPDAPGYGRVLGHDLELVPQISPIAPAGPGVPMRVKLLFHGRPLPNEKVSFIPRGQTLKGEFDPTYERRTDANGVASFEPKEANYYLIAVHHVDPDGKGPNYQTTLYSSTLTVIVPGVCPCCGE